MENITGIESNRGLYLFVRNLITRRRAMELSLRSYLGNLWAIADQWREKPAIPVCRFAGMLDAAFDEDELPRRDVGDRQITKTVDGFSEWNETIVTQIKDLGEMKVAGVFDNEYRYFGLTAPSGAYWYNFDVFTYLECAAVGAFGGWQPGDGAGRGYVPGKVAVIDGSGSVVSKYPEDIEEPVVTLTEITWQEFEEFLRCGQDYE